MELLLTEAARRIISLSRQLARAVSDAEADVRHLLWAVHLDESRGAEMLREQRITRDLLQRQFPLPIDLDETTIGETDIADNEQPRLDATCTAVLTSAHERRIAEGRATELGSEHLLYGLIDVPSVVADWLHRQGLQIESLARRLDRDQGSPAAPIDVDFSLVPTVNDSIERTETLRILDAASNRAREGARVMEDYARFVLDDPHLTKRLKQWRHDFMQTLSRLGHHPWVARETQHDVGTTISTSQERHRPSLLSVVQANGKRLEESLRSLEEYGKILSPAFGAEIEQLRYRVYTLEKAILNTQLNRERLADCRLYLLVTEDLCDHGSGPSIRESLVNGVSIVQMREKDRTERQLLEQGQRIRQWTRELGGLFIVNDRPDLAVLCDADGVHVGQDDLTVKDARKIVGPRRLIGVSTHNIDQARQAVLDGADYLGVGPVFASRTKQFSEFAGLEFVKQVADEITLPWFAIGGINAENVAQVLQAGASRIAVSQAICGAKEPGAAAHSLAELLAGVKT